VAARTAPFEAVLQCLDTIPGVDRKAAEGTVAELGVDLARFPTHRHLAAWAGLCPGNRESAGKRKAGKTRKGDVWFRRYAIAMALAASRTKGTYLNALYHRLVRRRGHKKAVVAVAHAIVVIMYHVITDQVPYQELGADYFDTLHATALTRHHVRRLETLGFKVTLEAVAAAA
jgi:transposase